MTVLRCVCGTRIEGVGASLLEAVELHLEERHDGNSPVGAPTRPIRRPVPGEIQERQSAHSNPKGDTT